MQELFFCEVSEVGPFCGTVCSNDLVNLTSFFGCDVQQERNWELCSTHNVTWVMVR